MSDALLADTNNSTSDSPKSNAVPAPREVTILPSTTTRSFDKIFFNSSATEGCAV